MSKINRFFNQKSTEFSNENQSKFCQFEHILSSIFMSTNMSLRHIIYLDPPVHMSKYIYIYYYIIFDIYMYHIYDNFMYVHVCRQRALQPMQYPFH